MTYLCVKGHQSTEADFCSDCGTKISGSFPADMPPPMSLSSGMPDCPDCTTPHDPLDGKFCEICGYNFETRQSAPVTIPPIEIPPLDAAFLPPPVVSLQALPTLPWSLRLEIDPSLAAPESPPAPTQGAIEIQLTSPTNLIGRHNTARGIVPEISLDFDDAVSSRHAMLMVQPDGQIVLRDIGSSNGTVYNGVELNPMQDYTLNNGDSFTLGHWTRITVMSH